jgi:small subunit ribosomal protein S17
MAKATKTGLVTGNKMDKTVVVSVERLVRHPLYKRSFKVTSKFLAHDEANRCQVGDRVRIEECRPLSRRKRWRVVDVVLSQKAAEGAAAGSGVAAEAAGATTTTAESAE